MHRHAKSKKYGNLVPGHFYKKIPDFFQKCIARTFLSHNLVPGQKEHFCMSDYALKVYTDIGPIILSKSFVVVTQSAVHILWVVSWELYEL